MKPNPHPKSFCVEIRIDGRWIEIDEQLPLAKHEVNARKIGATEIRTIDGSIHHFLNSKKGNK